LRRNRIREPISDAAMIADDEWRTEAERKLRYPFGGV